ncbi:hypothetical protein D3C71_2011460 [compost metagenome]
MRALRRGEVRFEEADAALLVEAVVAVEPAGRAGVAPERDDFLGGDGHGGSVKGDGAAP